MNIIKRLTKGCTGDCAISNQGSSTTCMYWEPVYDRTGKVINGEDPNIITSYYKCSFCDISWKVEQQGKTLIITPPVD